MERSANSWWLAATAVGDLETLALTVAAILGGGLSLTQICLFALEDTMSLISTSARASIGPLEDVSDLFNELFDWPASSVKRRIVATSRTLPEAFLHASGVTNAPPDRWSTGTNPGRDLVKHVESGHIGLLVRCTDGRQLSEVTRHLLANSTTKVTTHAFSYSTN